MRKVSSKLMALLLAFTLIVSTGIVAGAAPAANANEFSVKVTGNTVAFVKGGATVGSYAAKDSNLTVFTDKDGDLIVRFLNASGKPMWVTLGKQTNLTVDGKMNSLTLDKSLSKTVSIAIAPTAEAKTLSVRSSNKIEIQGTVSKAFVYSAATVTAASTSKISNITVTSKSAKVDAAKGAKIETARVASKSVLTGSGKPENVSTNVSASTGSSSGSSWGGSSGRDDLSRFDSSSKSSSNDKSSSTVTSSSKPPIVYDPETNQPIESSSTPDDPSTSDPSTSDPSTSDPSTSDPSTSDPSTSDPSTSDPSTSDPSTSDPSTSDPGPTPPPTTKTTVTIVKSSVTLGASTGNSNNITIGVSGGATGTKLSAIKAKVIAAAIEGATYNPTSAAKLTANDFTITWTNGASDDTEITKDALSFNANLVLAESKKDNYEVKLASGTASTQVAITVTINPNVK